MALLAFVAILATYVVIAGGVTYWLSTFGTTSGAKGVIALISIFAFLILAVWDEVWGYVYLRHLCATEGGIKVYRTVTLGAEHWNDDGSPKFITFKGGNSFRPFLDGRYQIAGTGRTVSRWPELVRSEYAVVDRQTKEQLSAYVHFSVGRGWLLTAPGWHAGGRSCESGREDVDSILITTAFKKAPSK